MIQPALAARSQLLVWSANVSGIGARQSSRADTLSHFALFPKEGHVEPTCTVQASFQLFGPTFVLISKDRRYGQSCVSNVTASEATPGQSPFSLCCSDTTEAVPRFHHCCSTGEAMLSLLSCHTTAEATSSTPHRGWERHGRSRVPLVPVGRARAMLLFQSLGTLT